MITHNNYSLRTFKEGDENELADLFNKTCEQYFGCFSMTPQYWKHIYLFRPDVKSDSIFIAENSDRKVVGYAVVGDSGNVYEISVHPKIDRDVIIKMLILKIERYAIDRGIKRISVSIPPNDRTFRKHFAKSGYIQSFSNMIGIPLNLSELIKQIMETRLVSDPTRIHGKFLLRLSKGNKRSRFSFLLNDLFVLIKEGKICIEPDDTSYKADVVIQTDVFTIINIITGKKSILMALLHREIKVFPFWKFYNALSFCH